MTFSTIDFKLDAGVAEISLNRPDAGNAIDFTLAAELAEAARLCDGDSRVRVVLLSARGRMFCVGGDLKAFAALGEATSRKLKALADEFHKAVATFARMPAPVVVSVNGMAAGAGFSLALIGDYVIASEDARLTMAYTAAGLSPDGSSTYYLPRLVGLRRAQELAFTNRVLSAAEALDWGIVTRVVPATELRTEAEAACRRLAMGPAGAHASVKQLLLGSLATNLETQMELEGRLIAQAAASPDGKEGIMAFLEKRAPVFR